MIAAEILAVLKERPMGLAFDIDGTLSPIAPTSDQARLYPGMADLLEQAKQHAHVGIITGRAVVDGARLVNIDGMTYIGTHGLEWSDGLPATHPVQLVPEALPYIEPGNYLLDLAQQQLAGQPGVIIQHKNVGGSVHYRLAPNPEQIREQILAVLSEPAKQVQMRLREGKRIVEILAPLPINKGHALRRWVDHFKLQGILFAGDDLTDLDAILEIERLRQAGFASYSIVVQSTDTLPALLEHADGIVQGVEGMFHLLEEIVDYLADQK